MIANNGADIGQSANFDGKTLFSSPKSGFGGLFSEFFPEPAGHGGAAAGAQVCAMPQGLPLHALLLARVWSPVQHMPRVLAITQGVAKDITAQLPTVGHALRAPSPEQAVRAAWASSPQFADAQATWLAPCDVQPVKAAGVTFAASLLERLIEEHAHGDAARAEAMRADLAASLGGDLAKVKPGSEAAASLAAELKAKGLWSQYLEVGIGPDAEIFTKCPPMAAVGHGAQVGIHRSVWNNPEPEVVLVVSSAGQIVGAALGNDVNLRDVEGRSALLLGRAKDNNGSTAIGPWIRLLDGEHFTLDSIRHADISLTVSGADGYTVRCVNSMAAISRDVTDLAAQLFNGHNYPDGALLFCGTMAVPTQDRGAPGSGFTHHVGDVVSISSPALGLLENTVGLSEEIAPWAYGLVDLISDLRRI